MSAPIFETDKALKLAIKAQFPGMTFAADSAWNEYRIAAPGAPAQGFDRGHTKEARRDARRDVWAAALALNAATLTVVVQELKSPLPPVYPAPLIYTVTGIAANDESAILDAVAVMRAADFGRDDSETIDAIRAGLELHFAFAGDLTPVADFRH